ncbi:MAG TPA: phosphoglycerate kinase [Candidatus Paceibacterota bacterium]
MSLKTIHSLHNLKDKRVLLRLDLNVPVENGQVVDAFRIEQSIPTVEYLRQKGAVVIIVAHIEAEEGSSLEVVASYLRKHFPVTFIKEYWTEETKGIVENAKGGSVILFENLRLHEEEKRNDKEFSKRLAEYGDYYVNEAFSVSHRSHASIVGLPLYLPSFIGLRFAKEIEHLSTAAALPHPFLFIIGGAKFETKLPLIEKFLGHADRVFVCGALAHDIFRFQGCEIGKSTVSEVQYDFSKIINNPKVVIPTDVVVTDSHGPCVKKPQDVLHTDTIYDAGPETITKLKTLISEAKGILWNGPVGFCERGFKEGTIECARAISENTTVRSIVGGGDTLAAIEELGIIDKFSFVSTGGGAMLEFLAKGTLPGIVALKRSQRWRWLKFLLS